MAKRTRIAALVPLLVCTVCSPPAPDADDSSANDEAHTAAELSGLPDGVFSRVHELSDDVYVYEQLAGPDEKVVTTLSMFVVTSEGVLVADGQGTPEDTQRLIDEIAKVTDKPITHVVICSDHGDHTQGNVAFPTTAVFYAHPTSAATLETSASQRDRSADAPPVILPTALVDERLVLHLGGKEVQILFLGRAHTGGDLVVYMPTERVLFMGETYFNDMFPAMRSAFPTEWIAMIERAEAMEVDMYVPGHAVVRSAGLLGRREVATHRDAVRRVIAEASRLHAAGLTADEAVEQANFGDMEGWVDRVPQGPRAVRRVFMEINGEVAR